MSTCSDLSMSAGLAPAISAERPRWYAVMTRAKHEKVVAQRLRDRGMETFLPTITQTHRWSDREKQVEVPLFGCYVFVKVNLTNESFYRVSNLDGVFRIVGSRAEGTPSIPDEQIEAIEKLLEQKVSWSMHPFLNVGQRVRIRGGSMDGVEGILVACARERKQVITNDANKRSMARQKEGYKVEPA